MQRGLSTILSWTENHSHREVRKRFEAKEGSERRRLCSLPSLTSNHVYVKVQWRVTCKRHNFYCSLELFVGDTLGLQTSECISDFTTKRRVLFQGLPKDFGGESLHSSFENSGPAISAGVMSLNHSTSRLYGYLHYEHREDAHGVVEKSHAMILYGNTTRVEHFKSREERGGGAAAPKNTNLGMKGMLQSAATETNLHEIFEEFGYVQSWFLSKVRCTKYTLVLILKHS